MKSALIVIFSILTIVLFSGCLTGGQTVSLPIVPECREVQIAYEFNETYTESEPYTSKECETVNLKSKVIQGVNMETVCIEQNCIEESFWTRDCKEWECVKDKNIYTFILKNMDDEGGRWAFRMTFQGMSGEVDGGIRRHYIEPEDEQTFMWEYVKNIPTEEVYTDFDVEEIPTKQVCENVIRYRDVEKTRPVTKFRTEEVCE